MREHINLIPLTCSFIKTRVFLFLIKFYFRFDGAARKASTRLIRDFLIYCFLMALSVGSLAKHHLGAIEFNACTYMIVVVWMRWNYE